MNDQVQLVNKNVIPVEAPSRVVLIPWGEVKSTAGDFKVDAESAAEIIKAFTDRGLMIPVDYEHQTMGGAYASPDGLAPAAGWIKIGSLEAVANKGIIGEVEWTANAAEKIKEKEYRYLSPVVFIRKSDRRVTALHSVALTNKPAITGMSPIVNKDTNMDQDRYDQVRYWLNLPATATNEEITMELEKYLNQLRGALGVDTTANSEKVMAVLTASLAELKTLKSERVAVCKALTLAEDAKSDDVVLAINSAKKPATTGDVVPKAEFDAIVNSHKAATERLAVLESRVTTTDAASRIAAAKAAGKLTDAMLVANSDGKNYFAELAKDETAFNGWLERTAVVAPANGRVTQPGSAPASGGNGDRIAIINSAKSEWRSHPELHRIQPDVSAYVRGELIANKFDGTLSDKDKELIAA